MLDHLVDVSACGWSYSMDCVCLPHPHVSARLLDPLFCNASGSRTQVLFWVGSKAIERFKILPMYNRICNKHRLKCWVPELVSGAGPHNACLNRLLRTVITALKAVVGDSWASLN